jgi:hypothetical protein
MEFLTSNTESQSLKKRNLRWLVLRRKENYMIPSRTPENEYFRRMSAGNWEGSRRKVFSMPLRPSHSKRG